MDKGIFPVAGHSLELWTRVRGLANDMSYQGRQAR